MYLSTHVECYLDTKVKEIITEKIQILNQYTVLYYGLSKLIASLAVLLPCGRCTPYNLFQREILL